MDEDDELEIHAVEYVLRLEKAGGENGYFTFASEQGIHIRPGKTGLVQRFRTRADAEQCAKSLVAEYGLDIEEATPELVIHDREIELRFGGGGRPDGMRVEADEKTGKRCLMLWQDGEEKVIYDLEDDAADLLVRLLDKLRQETRAAKPRV